MLRSTLHTDSNLLEFQRCCRFLAQFPESLSPSFPSLLLTPNLLVWLSDYALLSQPPVIEVRGTPFWLSSPLFALALSLSSFSHEDQLDVAR